MQEEQCWTESSYRAAGQWENWKNLLDMANAVRYGFAKYRLPKPGTPINVKEADERIKKVDGEWIKEYLHRGREDNKPCPNFSACSVEAKCYLHSILEVVKDESEGRNQDSYWQQTEVSPA